MNRTTAAIARARAWSGGEHRSYGMRLLALVLLAVLLVPATMMLSSAPAFADEDPKDYSLYQLASNASTYFGERNSPEADGSAEDRMPNGWLNVTGSPASAGSLLGYADPEFSVFNVIGYLFASVSGSSQTIMYSSLKAPDDSGAYTGLVDYAHFGATNTDLGLDSMSSGIGGEILSAIGGSLMWIFYALSLAVSTAFWVIIQFLKLINPFSWFYSAVAGVEGGSSSYQQELADGMTAGQGGSSFLTSLQAWIAPWYQLLQEISWQALVPLFIGFLLLGLVLFKKMDRGAAIKKLIVRIVFIGVGLPLLGSMYSGVLDKFDDSLLGQHSGPTRVVLSTYVDFESWMMNDRLGIPDQADISWSKGQASADSMMSVRRTALAINAQANPAFSGISIGTAIDDAESAWQNGTVGANDGVVDDVNAVFQTFGILNKYIGSQTVSASDFESGIKNRITDLSIDKKIKEDWFVNVKSYGDVERFGDEEGPTPDQHPVISVTQGLSSSNPGTNNTTFSTAGANGGCGFAVTPAKDNAGPTACNLAPLAAYNYLNTSFGPDSMTMFSSNNATSGFTRESHMAVSQVGTGPAKFMYWHNAGTVLGSIALLGFWYAIGMLVGAIKRTISLVAAVPFATLGAMAGIAKVIIYTAALILEVIVTLFIYQFVSEFLISVPDIIAGPVSSFMDPNGIFGNAAMGGIIVVILTLFSSLVITGITFALLRVRKSVLQAMDEIFTKLVDKFLDTNTAPRQDKGGLMPAMAAGVGAGVGMAAGQKLASGLGGQMGASGVKTPGSGGPGGKTQSTNAGGLNGGMQALPGGGQKLALGGGQGSDGGDGSGMLALDGGPGGGGSGGGQGDALRELPGGSGPEGAAGRDGGSGGDQPGDSGGPLQLGGARAGSSHSAKDTAQQLNAQGGLTNFGFSAPGAQGSAPIEMEKGADGVYRPVGGGNASAPGTGGSGGADGASSIGTSGGRKSDPAPTQGTRFGVGTGAPAAPGTPSAPAFGGAVVAPAPQGTPGVKSTRSNVGSTPAPRMAQSAPQGTPATNGRPAPTGRPARPVGTGQPARPVSTGQGAQGAPTPQVPTRRPATGAPAPQAGTPRSVAPAPVQAPASAPQAGAPRPAAPGRPVAQPAPAAQQPRIVGQAPAATPTAGRPAPAQRPVATGRPQQSVPPQAGAVPRTASRPSVTGRPAPVPPVRTPAQQAPVTPPRVERGQAPAQPSPATPSRRGRRQVDASSTPDTSGQRGTRKARRRGRGEKPQG